MNVKQKNSLLLAAIVSGLLSLPMTWLTIRNAQVFGELGSMFSQFGGMSINVTALNGSVTLLVKVPIWFVVCISIAASAVQLLRGSDLFAIPKGAEWGLAILGTIWTTVPLFLSFGGNATVAVGWLLGLFCAVVPLICLVVPTQSVASSDSPPGEGH